VRRFILMLTVLFTLAACGASDEPLPESIDLLNAAAANIHDAESFRIEVWREGAPYYIDSDVIEGNLLFDRAKMNYVAPDVLQGRLRAKLSGLPFELGILARGDNQWVQLPGLDWTDTLYFAPGFNPQSLIAEDSGFQAALNALLDIEMIGRETLEDGSPVYHMRGTADGPSVSALLVYMIMSDEDVTIDAYVHAETQMPVRLIITMPGTETEEVPEPTQWYVDVYDFNADVEITGPSYDDATEEPAAS
jgi:hypothetical protein